MITFNEVKEKDLEILASLYSAIFLNTDETWTYDNALSYMNYFYKHQPDLFICAYDDKIPIGAVMSILKPYYNGLHLTQTELFVSDDYIDQNIDKKLLALHFELANAKYNATHIDLITNKNNTNTPLDFYKQIGLEPNTNLVILNSKLDDCLKKLREELQL